MKTKDYTTSFTVDQSPEEVFDAINNVRGWWSEEIDGRTDQLGAEFKFRHKDAHRSAHTTELRFTHVGLVPTIECYGGCSGAWGFYINDSLRDLITTGKGQPAWKEAGEPK
jgi:hypothetical protein